VLFKGASFIFFGFFDGDASAAPEPRSLDGEVHQLNEYRFKAFVGIDL